MGSGRGSNTGPSTASLAALTGVDGADEQSSGEGEGDERSVVVDGVAGDPAGRFAHAFAAGELVGREVGGGVVGQELGGIGEEALLTGGGVDRPEAVDRVLAAAAAQEQDAIAARGHRDGARLAEREALRPGVLAWERELLLGAVGGSGAGAVGSRSPTTSASSITSAAVAVASTVSSPAVSSTTSASTTSSLGSAIEADAKRSSTRRARRR